MKKTFAVLSVVAVCWVCGCDFSDKDEIYNENNTTVKDGVVYDIDERPINGLYKVYYSNGNVKMQVQSKNGLPDGEGKFYDENGNLQFLGMFVGGKIDGKFYNYYEDGTVHNEMNYKNGVQDGEQKLFNTDGSLMISVMFENGKILSGYALEGGVKVPFSTEELESLSQSMDVTEQKSENNSLADETQGQETKEETADNPLLNTQSDGTKE